MPQAMLAAYKEQGAWTKKLSTAAGLAAAVGIKVYYTYLA